MALIKNNSVPQSIQVNEVLLTSVYFRFGLFFCLLIYCFIFLVQDSMILQGPSKEDILKKVGALTEELLKERSVELALSTWREQKVRIHH